MNATEKRAGGAAASATGGISMTAIEGMFKQYLKPIRRDIEAIRDFQRRVAGGLGPDQTRHTKT